MLTVKLVDNSQVATVRFLPFGRGKHAGLAMHIIGIVLAVVVGLATWWWRLKMIASAGSDIIDQVGKLRGAARRYNFRKRAEASVISSIQDPAVAAAVFLFSLANQKVAFLGDAKSRITELISGIVAADDVIDVVGFSEWVANSVPSPEDPIRRFRELWLDRLNNTERQEFLDMAREVASVGNGPSAEQDDAIADLKRALGR